MIDVCETAMWRCITLIIDPFQDYHPAESEWSETGSDEDYLNLEQRFRFVHASFCYTALFVFMVTCNDFSGVSRPNRA